MASNSRFAVATHILTFLANAQPDEPVTSDHIAASVNTNPVVIRRLLTTLSEAELIRTKEGSQGGSELAFPADQITLLDVYRAIDEGEMFGLHRNPPSPICVVGRSIKGVLKDVMDDVQGAMEQELAQVTIAQMLGRVLNRSRL
jgi:Rrf2 family protein